MPAKELHRENEYTYVIVLRIQAQPTSRLLCDVAITMIQRHVFAMIFYVLQTMDELYFFFAHGLVHQLIWPLYSIHAQENLTLQGKMPKTVILMNVLPSF